MSLSVGARLGHYTVTAKLGEGGMGEVWEATDTKLNRQVALKIPPEAFAADPDRLARFQREAQVLASLNHPGIAAIYGIEEQDDTRALVLELVEGPTLADRIAQGPIPVDEALTIAKQIAEALEAAHEAGVIHRDLKPANIKVRGDGTVKVLDFGLAKAMEPDATDPNLSQSPTISLTAAATQMGMVIGTAAYMAPEQAKGLPVDKRADIWAFGAVLAEMLSGKRPFSGGYVSETLAAVLRLDAELDDLPLDTPTNIRNAIRGCLQKDPKRRIRDIGDVCLAIEGMFESRASATPDAAAVHRLPLWQRPVSLLLVASALVVSTGWTVWSLIHSGPQLVTRFEIPFARGGATFAGQGRHVVAVSPNGRQIVYVTTEGLMLRSLDQVRPVRVEGTHGNVREPFFSPDSQSIGYFDQPSGQLQTVFASGGGAPVPLVSANNPSGASWGRDNTIVYGQGPDGIWRVSGDGGTPEQIITVEAGEAAHGPTMLPDGWVLFTLKPPNVQSWDEAHIVMESVTTGDRVVLVRGGRDARYVETGHLVYALNGVVTAMAFDLDAREVVGAPTPLVEGVQDTSVTGAAQFSVAENGSLVYVPGGSRGAGNLSLSWVTRAGEEASIAAPPGGYGQVRVSPDGGRLAVDIPGPGNTDVYIFHLDDGPLTRLTFNEASDTTPLWTPDGERVVFYSSRDGGGLFWRAADGTGEVERLLESSDRPLPWGWAGDGRLVFDLASGDVGVVSVNGEGTVEMLLEEEFEEDTPAISPDGRWIAYQSSEAGQIEIFVRPFPNVEDGRWQISTGQGFNPVWSPDGRDLFFSQYPQLMVAEVETALTFSRNTPREAFDLSGFLVAGAGRRYDIAPDGERFVFLRLPGARTTGADAFTGMIFVDNWFHELTERVPVD